MISIQTRYGILSGLSAAQMPLMVTLAVTSDAAITMGQANLMPTMAQTQSLDGEIEIENRVNAPSSPKISAARPSRYCCSLCSSTRRIDSRH
ncbi:Acid phosphatase [Fusarium oxysporum f. sp. albedinis]|nr:Acid phosphatase [Fusarium oxysporum f. sp. albedinis]